MPDFAVILPAAGSSTRFGGPRSKLFEEVGGKPVLLRSVDAFSRRADVRWIVLPTCAAGDAWEGAPDSVRSRFAVARPSDGVGNVCVCAGGSCRARSVWNAVKRVPDDVEWVAVHDAARPLVSQGLIDRTLAAAVEHGAAVPAMPVALTVKEAAGPLPARVGRTVPRSRLWAVQTPQVMRRRDLLDAFAACPLPLEEVTDDVQLLELAGKPVWLVAGEESNLKITTRTDVRLAELMLAERAAGEGTAG